MLLDFIIFPKVTINNDVPRKIASVIFFHPFGRNSFIFSCGRIMFEDIENGLDSIGNLVKKI